MPPRSLLATSTQGVAATRARAWARPHGGLLGTWSPQRSCGQAALLPAAAVVLVGQESLCLWAVVVAGQAALLPVSHAAAGRACGVTAPAAAAAAIVPVAVMMIPAAAAAAGRQHQRNPRRSRLSSAALPAPLPPAVEVARQTARRRPSSHRLRRQPPMSPRRPCRHRPRRAPSQPPRLRLRSRGHLRRAITWRPRGCCWLAGCACIRVRFEGCLKRPSTRVSRRVDAPLLRAAAPQQQRARSRGLACARC